MFGAHFEMNNCCLLFQHLMQKPSSPTPGSGVIVDVYDLFLDHSRMTCNWTKRM